MLAALAVGALLAAGCSSSGGSSGSAQDNSPIKLMVDTTMTPAASFGGLSFPYPSVGAKAAAAALNAKGGIDGHKIQIDVCDNKGNPNQSAACGRQAKSNGDIAVIGAWDIYGATQILPVLQAEGIPYIGSLAGAPIELTSPDSFNFDPGAVLAAWATAGLWNSEGCKVVAEFTDTSVAASAQELAGQQVVAKADGIQLHAVNITVGQADVTAPVSTAMSLNPDCVTYEGDGQTNAKLIGALRQAGFNGKIITAVGSLLPPFLKALGAVGDGVIALNTTLTPDSTDPEVTAFRNQVIAYAGGASAAAADLNEFAQDAWSSVRLVDLALTGAGSYTAAELQKKLPTMCDVNVGNVYPHVDFCKPAVQSTVFPRVYNTEWRYYVGQNGAYVPLDNQWHDLASTVPTAS